MFLTLIVGWKKTYIQTKANTSGSQSQKWKVDTIKKLLVRARGNEPKFIIRGLQGKLRIGLAQSTVLAAIAQAVVLTSPRGVELTEERMGEIRALDGTDGESRCIFCVLFFRPPIFGPNGWNLRHFTLISTSSSSSNRGIK